MFYHSKIWKINTLFSKSIQTSWSIYLEQEETNTKYFAPRSEAYFQLVIDFFKTFIYFCSWVYRVSQALHFSTIFMTPGTWKWKKSDPHENSQISGDLFFFNFYDPPGPWKVTKTSRHSLFLQLAYWSPKSQKENLLNAFSNQNVRKYSTFSNRNTFSAPSQMEYIHCIMLY